MRMEEEVRKWMVIGAVIWIQAWSGTNLDFSSYSTHLKSHLAISQLQLNYLSVASDLGKALAWSSGLSLLYLPLNAVLLLAAALGFLGYGLQWLLLLRFISLPYSMVFVLCFLGGCSVCWFNTVCFVLCIRNFTSNRAIALSLTLSFNGLSAALYTLLANAIDPDNDTLFLLLNSLVPLFVSCITFIPVARQVPLQSLHNIAIRRDSLIFLCLYLLAATTGLYLLCLNFLSSNAARARILLVGAIFLLMLPLSLPCISYTRDWARRNIRIGSPMGNFLFKFLGSDELDLHKELIEKEPAFDDVTSVPYATLDKEDCFRAAVENCNDTMAILGEEHPVRMLLRSWDFWLYYLTYFCGGTVGLIYSNNLGQICQSLGYASKMSSLVTLYSSWSFFGRLLAAAPDFLRDKLYFARTGWLAVAIVPTPIAIFLLAGSGSETVLRLGTALIALSSGFVFSAAVSITYELFGPNSAGVNHNILISNIPIGSLLYGLLAALVYDSNQGGSGKGSILNEATLCIGRKCYWQTFIWWGCISALGLVSSIVLFLRTKYAYDRLERDRREREFSL